jgi:type II secretory pathway component PulF
MEADELIRALLIGFIYFVLAIVPLALLWCGWLWLSSTLNREERARCFLTLLELGLQQGRSPEQTIRSLAAARVGLEELGPHFPLLAEVMQAGNRLSTALEVVPKFLPRRVRAMLRVGEELGELRRVLPACQATVLGAQGETLSISNNLVVLMFVSPLGPLLLGVLAVWVFPKLKQIGLDMASDAPAWSEALFEGSIAMAWFIAAALLLFWLGNLALPDRVELLLPWRRKRMQRDFSTMFSLLLDAGVPEARALRLGAECAANTGFIERANRAGADLQQGVKLPDAARRLDDAGEFAWRLRNAAVPGGSFAAALEGWHEALAAKAFQQQQTASQLVTTGFVFLNGVMVSLVALGLFRLLLAILDEAAL